MGYYIDFHTRPGSVCGVEDLIQWLLLAGAERHEVVDEFYGPDPLVYLTYSGIRSASEEYPGLYPIWLPPNDEEAREGSAGYLRLSWGEGRRLDHLCTILHAVLRLQGKLSEIGFRAYDPQIKENLSPEAVGKVIAKFIDGMAWVGDILGFPAETKKNK